jgi:single-strand DNA-binding protein
MNSCVLMAKIVRKPELRYMPESDLAVTDMMVEFDSGVQNQPPSALKVVAWGGLATTVEQEYREGDQIVLTGRLKMNLVERQGYKEKIAELTISHIYPLQTSHSHPPNNVVEMNNYQGDHSFELDDENEPMANVNLDEMPF